MSIRHSEAESPYQINFLRDSQREEIFAQGQIFIAQEQTRPLNEQTPLTPRIITLVEKLQTAYNTQAEAERQRTIASENLKQLYKKAPIIITKMWKSVTGKYADNPSEATRWGFKMKQRTRNVLRPQNADDRFALLNAYIAKEESQPEEERFRVPQLAEVIELRDRVVANTQAYQQGQNQQENSFEAIKKLTKDLSNCLQGSAIHLLGVEFKFDLSTQMQNWGYDITLKRKPSTKKETEPEAEANGDDSAVDVDASANGAVDIDGVVDGDSDEGDA
ncbi:MAG: hypothetical protein KDJ65_30680 [Anaerolineae bacterium]|nr:hypothetical protein [Anaerolineae bacterium]